MRFGLMFMYVLTMCAAGQQGRLEFRAVNPEAVEARLKRVPRGNAERQLTLRQMFEEAGCKERRLTEQAVKGVKQPNVICTLPGESSSTMVVGAHFDMVDNGMGVVDNWSGASLLPSIYQALAVRPRQHTFVFVGFSGEERGLLGSAHFVKQLGREGIKGTRLMIDLDSLGMTSTKIWLNGSDRKLAEALNALAAAMKLPLQAVNTERVGTTDSAPFAEKKIPTVSLHSLTQENLRVLHSNLDNVEAVKMDDYYGTYRLVTAYLTYLDARLE